MNTSILSDTKGQSVLVMTFDIIVIAKKLFEIQVVLIVGHKADCTESCV